MKRRWWHFRTTPRTWRASAAVNGFNFRSLRHNHGQTDWFHRISARTSAGPFGNRTDQGLERVPSAFGRGEAAGAGGALHGLRDTVLPYGDADQRDGVGLPDQQFDPGMERFGLS